MNFHKYFALLTSLVVWVFCSLTAFAQQAPVGLSRTQAQRVYILPLRGNAVLCLDASPIAFFEETVLQLQELERQRKAAADTTAIDSTALLPRPIPPVVLPVRLSGDRLKDLLDTEVAAATSLSNILRKQTHELDFYLKTHTKKDEGYKEVLAFAKKHKLHAQRVKDNVRLLLHAVNLYDEDGGTSMQATLQTLALHDSICQESEAQHIDYDNLLILHPGGDPEKYNFAHAMHRVFEVESSHTKSYSDRKGNVYRFVTRKINNAQATNFGERFGRDGSYFQGYFNDKNQREGSGYGVDTLLVKCGDWVEDEYRGQVMRHHPGRIYGIDISRYNHDMRGPMSVTETIVTPEGRDSLVVRTVQKVNIGWNDLRVTSLGPTSPKIDGEVSYPVDFVFIKCSEGKDLLSSYFNADLDSCLTHGIHVAPYHFYSGKSNAYEQAANFIQNGRINEATMRPMLDVEPEPYQLAQMGGIEKCLEGMTIFVQEVEKATGRRCVLYLNQNFVQRYYSLFPDELRKCDIWIAKYHERHPYSKHHIWQFTCKGRVNGIYGDVDLNVFNGNRADFEHWCVEE